MDPDSIVVANGTDECSDCSRRGRTTAGPALATAEALSAKQQVALWLTRASVSDLSAMSSLKSLVFPASIARNATASERRKSSSIKRNHSTKSLAVAWPKEEPVSEEPIRKCETVIALTNLSGSQAEGSINNEANTSTLSLFRKIMPQRRCPAAEVNSEGEVAPVPQSSNVSEAADAKTHRNNADEGITLSGYTTPMRGLRPVNRLRSTSSVLCSQCISVISAYNSRMTSRTASQRSLLRIASVASMRRPADAAAETLCKICLLELPSSHMMKLQECGCLFCIECMAQYIAVEVMSGAYDISCPDAECEKKGTLQIGEMEDLVGKELMDKHRNYRLNTEVALDSNRAWCPEVGCGAICHVCVPDGEDAQQKIKTAGVVVNCPSCAKEFCSRCSSKWHPGRTCEEYGKEIVSRGRTAGAGGALALSQGLAPLLADEAGDNIKPCPMCNVLIERDDGCAQMMCKRCKHVFCWHCGTSLDDDFLLRHYDSGRCKGLLGHSRLSVLWHRAQVIGIFAGFGIMLVVASPLLLLAAPCILCCRCKVFQRFNTADAGTADAEANANADASASASSRLAD